MRYLRKKNCDSYGDNLADPTGISILKRYVRLWPARYELLDGLRGLACLTVVLHHLGVIAVGHYAVMIFFVISGYCITAAVQSGLKNGLSFGAFMARRVRRIFPPYLLAVAFFAATRIAKITLDPSISWNPTWLQWLQNLTLTQWLSLPFGSATQASQNSTLFVAAFWSLNYEEQFYLVMGIAMLLAVRFRVSIVRAVLTLFAIGLVWNVAVPGGWITGLFIEYWVHFALGSLLFFVLCVYPTRLSWLAFVSGLLILAAFCTWHLWPWQEPESEEHNRVYVELAVLSTACLVLAALRPISETVGRSIIWKPIAAVGTISYSLYLVHQFNLTLVSAIVSHLLPISAPDIFKTLLAVLLHIAIGGVFWQVCERPFLNRRKIQADVVAIA